MHERSRLPPSADLMSKETVSMFWPSCRRLVKDSIVYTASIGIHVRRGTGLANVRAAQKKYVRSELNCILSVCW